jgi:hypothetical protein
VSIELPLSPNQEQIPDTDELYIRICKFHFNKAGKLQRFAFEPRKPPASRIDDCGKKSVDWSKVSSPQGTIDRTENHQCKQCYSLSVGGVRGIGLLVEHLPIRNHPTMPDNPAHSVYHSPLPLKVPRVACEDDGYEQPSEEQLDALCRFAQPAD